ncbi:histidine kinase [Actinoplanes sp. KI2]|uniref:sensor histidine kinase n=1 Tax=Actinoplanes sp. KI2 TaxID=2983315 RepID=UPI0021D5839D|nr:ATP-binding protein [Actinoplanes sp. KI2]MCU7727490.1 histidine kinase [Actinoplanes sp. KI2]
MTRNARSAGSRWGTRLFLAAFVVYLGGALLWLSLGLVGLLSAAMPPLPHGPGPAALDYVFSLLNIALGVFLVLRRPDDLTPRLLAVAFVGTAATFNAPSHAVFHLIGADPGITGFHFAFHVVSGVAYVWAVLLFPDGRLPLGAGRRATAVAAVASTAVITFVCYRSSFVAHPPFFVAFFGILVPVLGMGAQGIRLRYGSESPQVRQQSRLLCWALAPALAVALLWSAARLIPGADAARLAVGVERAFPVVFAVVPVMLFVAILRYRLWDIDHVVTRALAYSLLAAFIGLVYLAALAATALLAAPRGWSAIVALAVVAAVAEPVRGRLRALANRVVFGQRLTPREAMRTLADRLDHAASTDELAELTDVVVSGTRCSGAQLWLITSGRLLLAAAAPTGAAGPVGAVAPAGAAGPATPAGAAGPVGATSRPGTEPAATMAEYRSIIGADLCFPVTHEGDLLAVLALRLPAGVTLPRADLRLIGDLAGHAGLLVANARLTANLTRQVEQVTRQAADLRRSRLQVVGAHDDERRRLERDLHDGAQQELVALLLQLRTLQRTTMPSADQVGPLRRALAATRATLEGICTGNPPALLATEGLAAALEAATASARLSGLRVGVDVRPVGRLDPEVETALYFCALEAVQNATKHAQAQEITVRVERDGGDAVLVVIDDGTGFDPARVARGSGLSNLIDRLAVLGGTAQIASAPASGTALTCRVPASDEPAAVPA